jgi:hypothetical protein
MTTEERLAQAERQLAAIRWGMVVLTVILALAVSLGAYAWCRPSSGRLPEIRTRGITVYDDQGSRRAFLDGEGLLLYDKSGKNRAGFTSCTNEPGLLLFDENGKGRVILAATSNGPALMLSDENGTMRASLMADKDRVGLGLFDEHGTLRKVLGVDRDGPQLHPQDGTGAPITQAAPAAKKKAFDPDKWLADNSTQTAEPAPKEKHSALDSSGAESGATPSEPQNIRRRDILDIGLPPENATPNAAKPDPVAPSFDYEAAIACKPTTPAKQDHSFVGADQKVEPSRRTFDYSSLMADEPPVTPEPSPSAATPSQPASFDYDAELQKMRSLSSSVPQPNIGRSRLYPNVGQETWITGVMDSGEFVQLADRTLWQVSPLDRINTTLWLATTGIVVVEGSDPTYPYKLINRDDNETANAKLMAR